MATKYKFLTIFLWSISFQSVHAQADRWLQKVDYKMHIDFDVASNQFTGKQKLNYTNNSPDTLDRIFYHLYFNAFQPGSMMDVRSSTIADSDPRVGNRISKLKEDEIGFHKINKLTQDGLNTSFEVVGTILEVKLGRPIPPGSRTTLEMEFDSQVPIQIRRSGRDNKEGIALSMAQWYPKLCEYDYQGWHANPYVGREFHGVWGDFDVTISIDRSYILGGSGVLKNANEIGYGYEDQGQKVPMHKTNKLDWHFFAENVHDFVWAADPDYKHVKARGPNGAVLHFLYQDNQFTSENWAKLPDAMIKAFDFINEHYGVYPYPQYSFIQGGDGGMEYPMATLITGHREFFSLVSVSVHELMHSWYQMILGTNESLYSWMDEGFASYASAEVMKFLFDPESDRDPHESGLVGYTSFVETGLEEPLSTHADHFVLNGAYGFSAYTKGRVFLHQLGYIIGQENLDKTLLRYFNVWKFKHPNPNDFIRIAEKVSQMELDWYKEYWVNTTHTIDYGVESVRKGKGKRTAVNLVRIGEMPMPIDLVVELQNGDVNRYSIPLRIMRGEKSNDGSLEYKVLTDWPWTHPRYTAEIPVKKKKIKRISIDPSRGMADVNLENNEMLVK